MEYALNMKPLLKNLFDQHGDDLLRRGKRLAEEVRDGARDERTQEGIKRAKEGLHTAGEGITSAAEVFREGVKGALNEFQQGNDDPTDTAQKPDAATQGDVPDAVVVEDDAPAPAPTYSPTSTPTDTPTSTPDEKRLNNNIGETVQTVSYGAANALAYTSEAPSTASSEAPSDVSIHTSEAPSAASSSAPVASSDYGITIERMEFDCHAFRIESGEAFIENIGLRVRVIFPHLKPLRLALPKIEYVFPKRIKGELISELKNRLLRAAWQDLTALGVPPRSIAAAAIDASQQEVVDAATLVLFDADHLARMHWENLREQQAGVEEVPSASGPTAPVLSNPVLASTSESVTAAIQVHLPSGAYVPLKLTRPAPDQSPSLVFTELRQELRSLGFDDQAVAELEPVRRSR